MATECVATEHCTHQSSHSLHFHSRSAPYPPLLWNCLRSPSTRILWQDVSLTCGWSCFQVPKIVEIFHKMEPDFRSVRYFVCVGGEWISNFITTLPHKCHYQLKPSHWISGPQEVRVPFVVGSPVCCHQDNLLLLNSGGFFFFFCWKLCLLLLWRAGVELWTISYCSLHCLSVSLFFLDILLAFSWLSISLPQIIVSPFFILTLLIHGCKLEILIHHLSSKQYDF